jgi:beta-galactosidase
MFCQTLFSQSAISDVRKQLFNNDWKFLKGASVNAQSENFDDSSWRSLDLPHDWSIEGLTDINNPTGNDGGYFPAGEGWYRKKFDVPSSLDGKKLSVYFEGVYMNSEVFINGKSIGFHPYGYTSFRYDITPYIKYGSQNTIAVKVNNSKQKNCRWYSGSGIYRHVWMEVTNPVHVDHWGVAVNTAELKETKAIIEVKTIINNETGKVEKLNLLTEIKPVKNDQTEKRNRTGIGYSMFANAVNSDNQLVIIDANSKKEITQNIEVNFPMTWSPENPDLYEAVIHIIKDGITIDNSKTTFGIRSISYNSQKGFLLNGKEIKLNGGCVHHDNGCLGATAFDRAETRRVELLKAAGFNAVRTSHNPPSEAFLDACDRIGLLVIDEAFDGWRDSKNTFDYSTIFDEWSRKDIQSMVLRDRNHPSVVIWSTGNEIIERKKHEAIETATMLKNSILEIDTSRPVTSAMTTWDSDWEIFDTLFAVHDIGGYNYQLHRAKSDNKRVPSRVIMQTESYPRDAFANWKLVQENKYIIGDFVWTAMDYLGESSIGRYYYSPSEPDGQHWEKNLFPWHGAYCGDIDLTGWRKPISHYRDILYNGNEKLYMAVREPNPQNQEIKETLWSVWPTWESWTWPGYEGKNIQVEVYSKCPEVRLYLNNRLVETKPTTINQEYKAVFNLPYSAGTIRAAGVENGKEVVSKIINTAGKVTGIRLTADRKNIKSDGQDLSFITVELTDSKGILQPNADNKLVFSIEGPGVIAGVGNANLKDPSPYKTNEKNAWKGRVLVVVRSKHETGTIKLKVSSEGLKTSTLIIKTEK